MNETIYRLIHDSERVIGIFEAVGVTFCNFSIFEGTKTEIDVEITRLNLVPLQAEIIPIDPQVY